MTLKCNTTGQPRNPIINPRIPTVKPRQHKLFEDSSPSVAPPAKVNGSTPRPPGDTGIQRHTSSTTDSQEDPRSNVVLELRAQRQDIDRILEALDTLQEEFFSLKDVVDAREAKRNAPSSGFTEELRLLTDNVCEVGSRMNEVDTLKFAVQLLQVRIKRIEEVNLATPALSSTIPQMQARAASSTVTSTPQTLRGSLETSSEQQLLPRPNSNKDSRKAAPKPTTAIGLPKIGTSQTIAKSLAYQRPEATNLPAPALPITSASRATLEPGRKTMTAPFSSLSPRAAFFSHLKSTSKPSLNNNQPPIPTTNDSDSSDSEFTPRPSTGPQRTPQGPPLRSEPIRLPAPEWEKPELNGPSTIQPIKSQPRKRRRTTSYISRNPSESLEDIDTYDSVMRKAQLFRTTHTPNPPASIWGAEPNTLADARQHKRREGPRDKDGYLLRPNGTRDMRSVAKIDKATRRREAGRGRHKGNL